VFDWSIVDLSPTLVSNVPPCSRRLRAGCWLGVPQRRDRRPVVPAHERSALAGVREGFLRAVRRAGTYL